MHAAAVQSPEYKSQQASTSPAEHGQKKDRVTISLYGTEQDIGNFIRVAANELKNIKFIKKRFTEVAPKFDREPPEIVISVSIIPDWGNNSNYNNEDYKRKKEQVLKTLSELINSDNELKGIILEDFYLKVSLSIEERSYLNNLEAKGSNADMIKTHAIICPENSDRRHLQMDSNTKIFDFERLYAETFGRKEQTDALNASYYDQNYVSAHNKIVYTTYTTPSGRIAPTLKLTHLEYCRLHKDDQGDEKKTKNSIYSKDFVVALEKLRLVTMRTISDDRTETGTKHVYPAILQNPEYRITSCILTAVNMTWRNTEHMSALNALQPFLVGEALCDYACFRNVVKKYTSPLIGHIPEDCKEEEAQDKIEVEAHHALMNISDQRLEKEVVRQFVENVARDKFELLESVIAEIPKTPRGDEFFRNIFAYSAKEYFARKQEEQLQKVRSPK
jgi:hypothetical protein